MRLRTLPRSVDGKSCASLVKVSRKHFAASRHQVRGQFRRPCGLPQPAAQQLRPHGRKLLLLPGGGHQEGRKVQRLPPRSRCGPSGRIAGRAGLALGCLASSLAQGQKEEPHHPQHGADVCVLSAGAIPRALPVHLAATGCTAGL